MNNNITKIILIRHGQSIGNEKRIFLGHTDLDLTELGYKQAFATAEHLKNEKIDKIYSSDLIRALNTAIPHANLRNMSVQTSKNLRELYVGDWEGLYVQEIIEKWGREVFEKDWHGNFGLFTFPNGENIIEGGKRFHDEVLRLCNENEGKTILIAAHAAVIRSFWSIISLIKPKDIVEMLPFPSNASYSIAYCENGKITPFEYSIDDHLIEVGITKVTLN